ncbi:MAG TPA: DUF2249 domain-containing protein [Candidatus Limnocylindria bacterium]|nr:DUF2249 domain-containing protein [Candidatus Limnocylindria bacterium]
MISADTTIARLLDEHPELLEFLATYDAHFEKLRNRLLRRVMASRVTVAEAARMARVDPGALVSALRRAAGEAAPAEEATPAAPEAATVRTPKPAPLAAIPEARHVHVDVRPDIARGDEPFAAIMAAVKALAPGQALVLHAPFEPVPLYGVLARRGLAHWTDRPADDHWAVWFFRDGHAVPAGAAAPPAAAVARTVTIDVRDLEPPQPMVLVLERLDTLADDEQLEVIHSRRPLFLYPQLDERGFAHVTDEPEPGMVRIVIRRNAAA